MATMNISLPGPMRDWVEVQTENGQFANNSDYVRDLIRKDQQRAEKQKIIQSAITSGINSGDAGSLNMSSIKDAASQREGLDI